MSRFAAIALALTFASSAALAAAPAPSTPMPTIASSYDQPAWEASQAAYLAWNKTQKGWTVSDTGVQMHRVSGAGKGGHPKADDNVTINYEARLINGKVVDSSQSVPKTFPLPALIKAWREAVPTMRKGETWELLVPAEMAYGERDKTGIPHNSALIFQIELIDFAPQ